MKPRFALPLCLLLASCQASPSHSFSSTSSTESTSTSSSHLSSSVFSEESLSSTGTTLDTTSLDEQPSSSEDNSSELSSAISSSAGEPDPIFPSGIFDAGSGLTFDISGTPEAFNFISSMQCYAGAQYVDAYIPVTLTAHYQGQDYVYEEAGLRMKGNTSRHSFFSYGSFYSLCHFKVSLKATFDDEMYQDDVLQGFYHDWSNDAEGRSARKDREFFGLEKFDLKYIPRNYGRNGMCTLREIYAFESFRDFGVDAAYATTCTLTLRCGEETISGSYELIEPIDKAFFKRRYGKNGAKGDLYKCVYNGMGKADFVREGAVDKTTGEHIVNGKIGVEDNYHGYAPCYQLKTNDSAMQDSDFSRMCDFIVTLREVAYGYAGKEELESILDVDHFLKMSAASYLLGNFDDQRYNYNNVYVYFRADGKAILIPYDWDWCMGLEYDYIGMESLSPLDSWTLDGGTNSNLYLATLFGQGGFDRQEYRDAYLDYVNQMKGRILDADAYASFASAYPECDNEEIADVSAYMNEKLRHCA